MKLAGLSDSAVRRLKAQFDDEPVEQQGPYSFQNYAEEYGAPDVEDLIMWIDNDSDVYFRNYQPVAKNMLRKLKSGRYDHAMAPKGWMYVVDAGAKSFVEQTLAGEGVLDVPVQWHEVFPKAMRMEAAQELADRFLQQYENGELE